MEWNIFQFDSQYLTVIAVRLLLACLLGGIIGYEREMTHHGSAGFRTHILVSLGSCVVMLISEFAITAFKNIADTDPTRIGAQVVSGIGFLGAGAIMRHGITVKGITTAASIWAVACVGLACGIGFFAGALIATLIIWVVLMYLKIFEQTIKEHEVNLTLYIVSKADDSNESWDEKLKELGITVERIDARKYEDRIEQKITCRLRNKRDGAEAIVRKLMHMEGIQRVSL